VVSWTSLHSTVFTTGATNSVAPVTSVPKTSEPRRHEARRHAGTENGTRARTLNSVARPDAGQKGHARPVRRKRICSAKAGPTADCLGTECTAEAGWAQRRGQRLCPSRRGEKVAGRPDEGEFTREVKHEVLHAKPLARFSPAPWDAITSDPRPSGPPVAGPGFWPACTWPTPSWPAPRQSPQGRCGRAKFPCGCFGARSEWSRPGRGG
jgi:hypothetical protein